MKAHHLTCLEIIHRVQDSLAKQRPLSIIRIGDAENVVLAQNSVWSMEEVLAQPWTIKANKGHKGVHLPDIHLQAQLVKAIKQADIVGILSYNDKQIQAPKRMKRKLTDQVFAYFKLAPTVTCDATFNRILYEVPEFWHMLKNYRLLIISEWCEPIKEALSQPPYCLNITGTIHFSHSRQIHDTLSRLENQKDTFDIALLSCGVSAPILSVGISSMGKIGVDFGKGFYPII